MGGPSPLIKTHQTSDWLPENSEFYAEEDAYLSEWKVLPPDEHADTGTKTEPLVLKHESELPVIRESQFPYYPESAPLPLSDHVEEGMESSVKGFRRRSKDREGLKVLSLRNLVRKVLMKMKMRTYR